MLNAEPPIVYADSSALVKLVIEEPESSDLATYLATRETVLATSGVALVEVPRATSVADPAPEVRAETERLLSSCLLVRVGNAVLSSAADLASREVRTLDAIHLASAQLVDADEMLVYDKRLRRAAREVGIAVSHPGTAEA
ncbi:MAG TPA: type II toxin-antitoxin system VapC family toxin [Gaiellaceae bacterium]